MAAELIAALALVAANGFFVAVEFSVTRVRPTQVDELEREGRAGAKSVRHAVDRIDAYLAACQLGITMASLSLGIVGESFFEDLLEPVFGDASFVAGVGIASAIAFGIVTLLHVVVGELSPKSLAIARTPRTVLFVAPPMRIFYLMTKPIVDLFNGMGNLLLKPFGVPPAREAGHAPHTEEEIRTLLRESRRRGAIEEETGEYTERAIAFGDRRAREIMTPRPDIDFLTTDADLQRAAQVAIDSGHTRMPLCEPDGDLDAPVGLVHSKDLLRAAVRGDAPSVRELARPLLRFSESTLIDELLADLRRQRQHIALVVDEHGTTIGLVTLEDLVEEIVGEIEDEFDPERIEPIRIEGRTAVVKGSAPVREVSEELGLDIEDHHEATIGGHVMERLGRLPAVGERLELDDVRVEVSAVGEAWIAELRIELPPAGDEDRPEGDEGSR